MSGVPVRADWAGLHRFASPRAAAGDRGFTVAEVLAALGVLGVALVGVLFSMTYGATGVDASRRSTTALFLAEQRMEQVKAFAMSRSGAQGWTNLTAAAFPAEGYGTMPGHGDYRRAVTITDNPGGAANTKQVEVQVAYRPVRPEGIGPETSVVLSTLLVKR